MDYLVLLILVLISFALGSRLLSAFCIRQSISIGLEFLTSIALGFALLGNIVLLFGIYGFDIKVILYLTFFIGLISLVIDFSKQSQKCRFAFRSLKEKSISRIEWFFILIIVFLLICIVLIGSAPLTGSDAMQYHFYIPKLYAKSELIFPFFWSVVAFKLGLSHHLILLGMILSSEKLALLINILGGLLSFLSFFLLSREFLTRKISMFLVVFFISTPMVYWQIFSAGIDLWTICYCLLSLHFYILWLEKRDAKLIYLCAFFAGISASVKFTLLLCPLILVVLFLVNLISSNKNIWKSIKFSFRFSLFALLGSFPPFLRNFLWTGDPLYPLFTKILSSGSYSREFLDVGTSGEFSSSVNNFFLYPFKMILDGERYGDGHFFGVVILSFFPLLIISFMKEKGPKRFLINFSFVFFVFMFFAAQIARYLFPIFPVLLILSIDALKKIEAKKYLKFSCWAIVSFSLFFNLSSMLVYYGDSFAVSLGLEKKESYLNRKSPEYKISKFFNKNIKNDAKVLLAEGLHHRYYFNADNVIYNHHFFWDNFERKIPFDSAREFSKALRSHGFTHIMTFDFPGLKWSRWGNAKKLMDQLELCCLKLLKDNFFLQRQGSKRFENYKKIKVAIYKIEN